jgi:hypothetical protein
LYAIEPTNERIYIQQASAPIRTFDGWIIETSALKMRMILQHGNL